MLKTEYHRIRFQRSHPWISIILILCFAHSFALPIENLDSGAPQLGHAHNSTSSDHSGTLPRLRRSTESESVLSSHAYTSESSNSTGLSRFRRNPADKFANSISKFEALARISSGVSLEIGLIDGTITSDDVIAELLHMGDLKPQAIIDLDEAVVDNGLKMLERFSSPPQEVAEIEKRLVDLDGIRQRSAFMMSFDQFPGRDDYKATLSDVVKIKDVADTTTMESTSADLKRSLTRFSNWPEKLTDEDVNQVLIYAPAVVNDISLLETAFKDIDTMCALLKAAKKLKNSADFLELLYKEKAIRPEYLVSPLYGNAIDSILQNMESVSKARSEYGGSRSSVELIQTLVQTRQPSSVQTFVYSSGFPHGHADLAKLNKDTSNDWILTHVSNSDLVRDSLKKAFSLFDGLVKELGGVQKLWEAIGVPTKRKTLEKLIDAQMRVYTFPENLQPISDAVKALRKCESHPKFLLTSEMSDVDVIKGKIDKLNEKMSQLSTLEYAKSLKDLQSLKSILTPGGKLVDKTLAQEVVTNMKSSDNFKSVVTILDSLLADLKVLPSLKQTIPVLAEDILKEFSNIDPYYNAINKENRWEFYKCLNEIGEASSNVKHAILTLQKTRLDTAVLDEAKAIIGKILESRMNLKSVKTKSDQMKSVKTRETKLLSSSFNDSQDASMKLGQGVQGLAAIGLVHNAKANLKPLLENVDEILKDSLLLSPEHQKSLQELKSLPDVFKTIDYFLDQSYGRSVFLRKPDVNFKDQGKIFEEASKIKDLIIDIKALRSAMEDLKLAVPKKYDHLMTSLDTLETLDMHFSRFQIQNAIPSLTSLDVFFEKYAKVLSTPKPTSLPIEDPPPVSVSSPRKKKIKESDHFGDFLEVSWVFILSVLIIVGGIICILWCNGCCSCCCRKKKDGSKKEKK